MSTQSKQKDHSSNPFSAILEDHGFKKPIFDEVHFIKNHSGPQVGGTKIVCKFWEDTNQFECREVPS